jgi:hypothetical protein
MIDPGKGFERKRENDEKYLIRFRIRMIKRMQKIIFARREARIKSFLSFYFNVFIPTLEKSIINRNSSIFKNNFHKILYLSLRQEKGGANI